MLEGELPSTDQGPLRTRLLRPASIPKSPADQGLPKRHRWRTTCSARMTLVSKRLEASSSGWARPGPLHKASPCARTSSSGPIRGMWACCNRRLLAASLRKLRRGPERVGRCCYDIPASVCEDCGSRVLELLYCFECGDASLGGFVVDRLTPPGRGRRARLHPGRDPGPRGAPGLQGRSMTTCGTGRAASPPRDLGVDPQHPQVEPSPESKAARSGSSSPPSRSTPPWGYPGRRRPHRRVGPASRGLPDDSPHQIPALPERCPRCDTEYWNDTATFFGSQVRSPIRAHTSGAAQSTQLYLSQLVRSMGADPRDTKTIVFTDSRDDAARTAAGVAKNHYRDVVRQVSDRSCRPTSTCPTCAEVCAQRAAHPTPSRNRSGAFTSAHTGIFDLLQKARWQPLSDDEQKLLDAALDSATSAPFGWGQRSRRSSERFVAKGMSPAGPGPNAAKNTDGSAWWTAFEPPPPGKWTPLAQPMRGDRRPPGSARPADVVSEALFDRASRDVESVGLARVYPTGVTTFRAPLSTTRPQVLDSVVRILGIRRRWIGGDYDENAKAPVAVRTTSRLSPIATGPTRGARGVGSRRLARSSAMTGGCSTSAPHSARSRLPCRAAPCGCAPTARSATPTPPQECAPTAAATSSGSRKRNGPSTPGVLRVAGQPRAAPTRRGGAHRTDQAA